MSKVAWLSPAPLWDDLLPLGGDRFRAPALLRFASDAFMEDFQALLAARPRDLRALVARHETWRRPAAGLEASTATSPQLKLFQPIHGRFYLVSASLACRTPGLPEHTVDLADGESVAFVLRRVTTDGELAWVSAPDGTQGWAAAAQRTLAAGEETLPMFPTTYAADDLTRRVFAGLVPVGRREAYAGARAIAQPATDAGATAAAAAAPQADPLEDPRIIEFQRAVLEPWVQLRDWHAGEVSAALAAAPVNSAKIVNANVAAEQASALILLDFATYLQEELPTVWAAIGTPSLATALPTALRALYDALDLRLWTRQGTAHVHLRQALVSANAKREDIEKLSLVIGASPVRTVPDGLTPVLLTGNPFAAVNAATQTQINADEAKIAALLARSAAAPEEAEGVRARRIKHLVMQALAALPAAASSSSGSALAAVRAPMMQPLSARGDDLYIIRCVYSRPRCGRGHVPLMSDASAPFQLASFFDPDAPQRPVRVALPIDTSAAGLRKFDKNVAFVLSNELRKQMSRVKGLKELMDGDVKSPGGLDISVICSLSIPIITLCALILLMIIVSLLNFIFWWVPFLMMCFPVPSLKAKP